MSASARPGTVLVVDDYDANRILLQDVLELEGFRVFGACDGKEALRLLAQVRPSVILLDIKMPVLNGHELLFELRGNLELASIPVVLVTADREAGRISGVAAFIKKPFDLGHLVATVKRCAIAAPRLPEGGPLEFHPGSR